MVHPVKVNDQTATQATKLKDQNMAEGLRATNKNHTMKTNKLFSGTKPDSVHSIFVRGCERLEARQYSETCKAIADFSQCIEFMSQNTATLFVCEVYYNRGSAYQNIGKNNEALKDFGESINLCRVLGAQGKSLLQKNLERRGQTYQAMHKLDMALRDIDEVNKLTGNRDPYCLCCRASVYASQRDYKKAVEDLDRASAMGCDQNVEALLERASVLIELGKHDIALTDLEKALTLSHGNIPKADIYFRRGLCDQALKNRDHALTSFEQAIKLNPRHARAHFHIGMIQAEKGQLNEALRTLTKAHELAPHQRDILLERSLINRKLGKVDNADEDLNHGIQLGSVVPSTIVVLHEKIKEWREEVKKHGPSSRSHFELATAYDGLLTNEQDPDAQNEYYREAISEYHSAIKTDLRNMYPQARALLAICQKKMDDVIEAHKWHLDFYNSLSEHQEAVQYWEAFLEDINEKLKLSQLEPHLDESIIRKLMHMERNRRAMDIDEDNYKNDVEDRYKNQLAFYLRFRNDLANVLAAIGLSNLDDDTIADNLRSSQSKIGDVVELLSGKSAFVPEIESVLSNDGITSTKTFQKGDFVNIKKRVKFIGGVGDLADQIEIAQLVARHMCTRYRSQLICLIPNDHSNINSIKSVEEVSPSKSWWKCCSDPVASRQSRIINWNETVKKISVFATAFIIHAIINENIRSSTKENLSRREALGSMLVLIVCRAHRSNTTSFFQSITYNETNNLLIEQKAVLRMLGRSRRAVKKPDDAPIQWDLYEFFRGPGIYFYSGTTSDSISRYGSGPSMKPKIYGYRLGTEEEIAVFGD